MKRKKMSKGTKKNNTITIISYFTKKILVLKTENFDNLIKYFKHINR